MKITLVGCTPETIFCVFDDGTTWEKTSEDLIALYENVDGDDAARRETIDDALCEELCLILGQNHEQTNIHVQFDNTTGAISELKTSGTMFGGDASD